MSGPVLYVPLLSTQADLLVDAAASSVPLLLAKWDVPQLASVAVIQNLPSLAGKSKSDTIAEKALAELISVGVSLSETHPPGAFASLIASRFNRESFERGLTLMAQLRLRFLDQETLEARQFLAGSQWNFSFCAAHAQRLNPLPNVFETPAGKVFCLSHQQSRTFRVIQAEPDESIHIQGLAGTGKTHMIERLIESLSSCRPLLLAFTAVQLKALMRRVGSDNVRGMTFGELATYVLERDARYRAPGKRASSRHQLSSYEIASRLGFRPIGSLSPAQVASLCARMVAAFCSGTDAILSEHHIPRGLVFSPVDRVMLVEYAQTLWEQTAEPTDPRHQLPLRGYHRIKHMTLLHEAVIGEEFTHIIVDEAHDLSWSLASFLDRCSQPVITLGDACQRLDGRFFARSTALRKHEITHSIRAGRQIESVINPLINQHPVLQLEPLHGNTDIETKVVYYDKPDVPEGPVTILVDSEWGLFEWFQRLASAGAKFSLLSGAVSTFRLFILDCIDLFHEGVRPTHSGLFRYTRWDDLRADMCDKSSSFQRIDRLLSKGYSSAEFEASLLNLDASGDAKILLGRVMDARNSEIGTVMLAPDLLGAVGPGDRTAASCAFNALYTGGSRARHKLIVPGYLRDWASDVATKASALS